MPPTAAIATLNAASRDTGVALLTPLVERSPWVAEAVIDQRPFATGAEIATALVETLLSSPSHQRLALFRAHPELAGHDAVTGRMTEASTSEQGRLGLVSLPPKGALRLARLNTAYRARFDHPFIIALHRIPDLATLFDVFERRLRASPLEEHMTTLAEIASVISSRAAAAFGTDPNSIAIPHTQEHTQ